MGLSCDSIGELKVRCVTKSHSATSPINTKNIGEKGPNEVRLGWISYGERRESDILAKQPLRKTST